MHDVLRFWLDRGVDGFRIDVVQCIGKRPGLPDEPAELVGHPAVALNDCPDDASDRCRDIRASLRLVSGERMMVGEVYLLSTAMRRQVLRRRRRAPPGLQLPAAPRAVWTAAAWRKRIETRRSRSSSRSAHGRHGCSPTTTTAVTARATGRSARAGAAAVLLLTLRGTPFLYQGEELGLEDAVVPAERRVDPGGRDGCRAPIPWTPRAGHGWAVEDPWLPWPPEAGRRSVESERDDPRSMLHLYRAVLTERRTSPALRQGEIRVVPSPEEVLAYERRAGDDLRRVLVSFADRELDVPLDQGWTASVRKRRRGTVERPPATTRGGRSASR